MAKSSSNYRRTMARHLKVAAAQLGPIQRAEKRESVVKRLIALLREAASSGCKLVVFPELPLTTFFPRYYMEDQREVDSYFETSMPNPAVEPLFHEAKKLAVGFDLGYANLTPEDGKKRRFH